MNPSGDARPGGAGVAQEAEPVGDARLARALEEYRGLLEAGSAPDRAAFLARHSEVAQELAECLSGLEFVHAAVPALSGAAPPLPPRPTTPTPSGVLGDFRIIREVGRGGMGVVYEAEQTSLGRRVALKVLPLAATMDPRHLQRFQNEARAAASLHHTNIVPVYSVGSERGVYFYAMQFIDGRTIADVIGELRRPAGPVPAPAAADADAGGPTTDAAPAAGAADPKVDTAPAARQSTLSAETGRGREHFRRVAQWGVQAAEALDCAHQAGIVHRDVKPANLMLDARGHLWVTDFGLAHVQQGEASLTMTGDLVGTLRYMSPEQALAKRVPIDHRTDVYSLGATLYELLTLEPAFPGGDRQEVLRQIAFEEPRPPRRLNRTVPVELETIIGKAMQKSPADRYATAQELADDLRRFLDDKPIRARRPTLALRVLRVARRYKAVAAAAAGTAAAALVLAVVLLLIKNAQIESARQETDKQYRRAEAALQEQAEQRRRAEDRLNLAMDVLDEICVKEAERRFDSYRRVSIWEAHGPLDEVDSDPLDVSLERDFIQRGLTFYEKLIQADSKEPSGQLALAKAYRRVGTLRFQLNQLRESEDAYRKGILLLERLVEEHPGEPEYALELADACYYLGEALRDAGRLEPAEQTTRRALALFEKLTAQPSDSPRGRAGLAYSYSDLGKVLAQAGRARDAEQVTRQALALSEKLVEESPRDSDYCINLGWTCDLLAGLLRQSGRALEAEQLQRDALTFWEKEESDIGMPVHHELVGELSMRLGEIFRDSGRPREAATFWRKAQAVYERFVTNPHPDARLFRFHRQLNVEVYERFVADPHPDPWDLRELAYTDLFLANALCAVKDSGWQEEAEKAYRRSADLGESLVAYFPKSREYKVRLTWSYTELARLLREGGRLPEAERVYRDWVALWEKGVTGSAKPEERRTYLLNGYTGLVEVRLLQGRHADAAQTAAEWTRVFSDSWESYDQAALLLDHCVSLVEKDAKLSEAERQAAAKTYADRANALRLEAEKRATKGRMTEAEKPVFWANRGTAYLQQSQWEMAAAAYTRAIALKPGDWWLYHERCFAYLWLDEFDKAAADCTKGLEINPRNTDFCLRRAEAYKGLGQRDKALADYTQAVAVDPQDLRVWYSRGDLYADLGEWDKAAADFAQAVKTKPDDPATQYRHALAALGNRDPVAYRIACAAMVAQFARSDEPTTAYWAAWTCALEPESVEDLDACVGLAERAAAGGPKDQRYVDALGAVLYRAGRFKEAVERLDEANAAWEQAANKAAFSSPAYTWFFLAMAHHRLGHAEEARAWLDKGVKWAEQEAKNTGNEASRSWNRQLTLHLLRAEAEGVVERQPK